MRRKTFTSQAAAMLIFGLLSCATNRAGEDSAMYSMIYDYENNGVQGAGFYIDGKLLGESDVHGRFMIMLDEKKEYTTEIKKSGYKTETVAFYYDPSRVLYVKMGNARQFTALAEKSLDLRKYSEALIYVNYALELDSSKADSLYLKAIILNKTGRFGESSETLSKIKRRDSNKKYIEALEMKNNKGESL